MPVDQKALEAVAVAIRSAKLPDGTNLVDWLQTCNQEDCKVLGIDWPASPYDRGSYISEDQIELFTTIWAQAAIAAYEAAKGEVQPVAEVVLFDPRLQSVENFNSRPHKIIDASMAFMDTALLGTKLYARPTPTPGLDPATVEACCAAIQELRSSENPVSWNLPQRVRDKSFAGAILHLRALLKGGSHVG